MTRILIADDHAVVRSGVRRILADHPGQATDAVSPTKFARDEDVRARAGTKAA